jgi:predicted nuclease of restriction endonuclease-like RecB superfamily
MSKKPNVDKIRNPFEAKVFKELQNLYHREWEIKYEPEKLAYYQEKYYTPDFVLESRDGSNKIYIETKGYFMPQDRRKMIEVKKQHPDKRIVLVFQSNNKLSKGSTTRYSDWAEKHGFEWTMQAVLKEYNLNVNH